MGSVYVKNKRIYVRYKDLTGRWRDTATTAPNKTAGKELLRDIERKIERQRRGLEPIDDDTFVTFGHLMDWWYEVCASKLRSWGNIKPFCEKHLRRDLADVPLREVTAVRLEALMDGKDDDLSPRSINHLRGYVQWMFSVAIRRGKWHRVNPVLAVPKKELKKRLPKYLRVDEVPRVLAALPLRWRLMAAVAIYLGLRRGEILALRMRIPLIPATHSANPATPAGWPRG